MIKLYQYFLLSIAYIIAMAQTINGDGNVQLTELIKMAVTCFVYLGTIILTLNEKTGDNLCQRNTIEKN